VWRSPLSRVEDRGKSFPRDHDQVPHGSTLGHSQEDLNRGHEVAGEYRALLAARGPQSPWEAAESDSDFDDAYLAPLRPPPSPRREGPDLSESAWGRRRLADLARRIEPKDCGFDSYETWRSQMIAEHTQ